ncbi:MAG: hypothetical protein PSN34_03770, partial [Urechidicola sp.]|nr:hypothetical protein [Urechidicola sp.]
MKKEDVTNRKELMIFLLLELHKKNRLVDFGDFFMESGYAQGVESFKKTLNDMHEKGWLTKIEERNGKYALGMEHLPLLDLKYGIDIDGIEYLEKLGLIEDKFKIIKKVPPNINNTISISESTIGQVAQSSEKIALKSPITQKINHKTDNPPNKKSWIEISA